ncbi:cytochrome C [Methylacidimicrobium tartarophylax]|uniref:Nicotinate dehydrogenase subunit B n=1 Tax=Methylacidimicrobium tartarophylax TaxID=1041768 RepID=A0A5E6M616_9BACT|nr:cytochrome C [Methylacidimicrobium tartarophylax]VVM04780.1 Nicotinate dehydrogenase subunit B [Methylacidimicrobium tartarophylax]
MFLRWSLHVGLIATTIGLFCGRSCFGQDEEFLRQLPDEPMETATAEKERPAEKGPGERTGERIQHGKYLVEAVALCSECHTPRNERGELLRDKWLQGGFVPGLGTESIGSLVREAPPIAGLPEGWSQADMVQFLETGMNPAGKYPRLPMPPYRMSHADALAITLYLEGLKSKRAAPEPSGPP